MSQQDSVNKEVVIRGVLASLIEVPGAPSIDPGELVIFLEKEARDWCTGQAIELTPLWYFCVHRKQWTEVHFQRLTQSLSQLFSYQSVVWSPPDTEKSGVFVDSPSIEEPMPAVPVPRSSEEEMNAALDLLMLGDSKQDLPQPTPFREETTPASPLPSVPVEVASEVKPPVTQEQTRIIRWMISAVRQSPIHEIIDPDKLEEFLQDSLSDMWEDGVLQLQDLWAILSEPAEVTNDVLVCTFLRLELTFPQELTCDVNWPPMLKGLGQSQRTAIVKSMGLEPPTSWLSQMGGQLAVAGGNQIGAGHANKASLRPHARTSVESDSKTPTPHTKKQTPPSAAKTKPSGNQQAFEGNQTGNPSNRSTESASKPPRPKKTENSKSNKDSRAATGSHRRSKQTKPQGLSVPMWAAVLVGVLVLGSVGYYLIYGPVSLSGQVMNVKAYSEYVPLHDLRILGTTVQAMPKSGFFLDSESVQQAKLHLLYTKIKHNNSFVTGMAIYGLRGQFLKNYVPPAPPAPPKRKTPETPAPENSPATPLER